MASVYGGPATTARSPSPDRRFIATVTENRVTTTDSHGQTLVSEDYHHRDYHPEQGHWSRSGRFYVYPIYSQGGHSPWHKPFVVVDTQTRRTYTDSDLGEDAAVTDFNLSGNDTIFYQILDRSKEDWKGDVPGLPRRFSLATKITALTPAK